MTGGVQFINGYRPVTTVLNRKQIAGPKTKTLTGKTVSFDGTYNDSAGVKIYGHSEQIVTVQGKNLHNGALSIPNKYINTSGNLFDSAVSNVSDYIPVTQNKNYVLSMGSGSPYFMVVTFYDNAKTVISGISQSVSIYTFVFTAPPNCSFVRYHYPKTNESLTQLELGSTATPYEPFIPDSPSPNYPSQINSVTPFDLVVARKNLFDTEGWYSWLRTFTTIYAQKATVDGISCIYYRPEITFDKQWMKGAFKNLTSYTLSYKAKGIVGSGTSTGFVIKYTDGSSDRQYVENKNEWQNITMSSNSGKTIDFINMAYMYGQGVYIDENSIMLSEGSATPYEPFIDPQIIHIPYELRGLPNGTRDYIDVDNAEMKVWLVRNVGRFVLTSTNVWAKWLSWTETEKRVYMQTPPQRKIKGVATVSSNVATYRSDYWNGNDKNIVSEVSSNEYIYWYPKILDLGIDASFTQSEADIALKAYLSNNEVYFDYVLQTPITTDITATPEGQSILQAVKTHYPFTQFYTTGSTIEPELEVTVKTTI